MALQTVLPTLPVNSVVESYGSSAAGFDGEISLAGPLSLAVSDHYHHYGLMIRRSTEMWIDMVNIRKRGLFVGNKSMSVRLTLVDDASSPQVVGLATEYAGVASLADFFIGPYSSTLTSVACGTSYSANRIMMASNAATPSVIAQNNLTFGTTPPSHAYLPTALSAISSKATALGMLGALQAGFVQADATFTRSVCSEGVALAIGNGISVPNVTISTVPIMPTLHEMIAVLRPMMGAGIDIVVGCTYNSTGYALIEALQAINYSPKALVLVATYVSTWEGEYVISPSTWHRTVPQRGTFSNMTSMQFADEYAARFGGEQATYQAASAFASLCALGAAIEAAESLETSAVASQLRSLDLSEFYLGRISFDQTGMVDQDFLALQVMPGTFAQEIVAPQQDVTIGQLVFPMPPWEQRWCKYIGPGKTRAQYTGTPLPLECAGHGSCSTTGICICTEGYGNLDCSLPSIKNGANIQTYGGATEGHGVISIASPLSISPQTTHYATATIMRRAAEMWVDMVNVRRGGLTVGATQLGVTMTFVDDGSSATQVGPATRYGILVGEADFTIGPYTSYLTAIASKESFALNKIMIGNGGGLVSAFANNLTFGVVPPSQKYFTNCIRLIADEARELGILNTLKAGFLAADTPVFADVMCGLEVSSFAQARGIHVAFPNVSRVPKVPPSGQMTEVLLAFKEAGVNVIFGCTYKPTGLAVIEALQAINYSPKALVLVATYVSTWEGEYVISPSTWHRTVPQRGTFSNMTSMQFADEYAARFGGEQATYQAASAFASLCALGAAIEAAESLETSAVASQLRSLDLSEFYLGRISFDQTGMVDQDFLALQVMPGTFAQEIVAPQQDVTIGQLVFPMPPWEQRWCKYIGPGKTRAQYTGTPLPLECSGHGSCSTTGICICDYGWSGNRCEQQTCSPGYGYIDGSCQPCSSGHYKNAIGLSRCIPCPAGFVQGLTAQTSCIPCQPGSFAAASGSTICEVRALVPL